MNTRDRLNKMIYEMRDRGIFPELDSGTGSNWQDKHTPFINELLTIRRLANKHHKLAEMECNGAGVIRRQSYYGGNIDDWARREYGYGVKSSYIADDVSVFSIESDKVEAKIKGLCDKIGLRVEFQGDPRGYTCKFYMGDRFLDIQA